MPAAKKFQQFNSAFSLFRRHVRLRVSTRLYLRWCFYIFMTTRPASVCVIDLPCSKMNNTWKKSGRKILKRATSQRKGHSSTLLPDVLNFFRHSVELWPPSRISSQHVPSHHGPSSRRSSGHRSSRHRSSRHRFVSPRIVSLRIKDLRGGPWPKGPGGRHTTV